MQAATLPATLLEASALQFAREFIRKMEDFRFPGMDVGVWHSEAGRQWLRHLMKMIGANDAGEGKTLLWLIQLARAGLVDADLALRDIIIELQHREQPLPKYLATYNAEILAGSTVHPLKGRKLAANMAADIIVATLVSMLTEPPFNLKATGNSRRQPNGCRVAADALAAEGKRRGGEDAVKDIWKRFGPAIRPTDMAI
jgi:hypothetical protein